MDVVAGSGRDGLSGAQKAMLNRYATIPEIAAPNVSNLDAEMTAKAHMGNADRAPNVTHTCDTLSS